MNNFMVGPPQHEELVVESFSGPTWSHSPAAAYKIITQRLNIIYKLYGLWQASC